jgi:hypothetical protein
MMRAGSGRRASLLQRANIRVRSVVAARGPASAAPPRPVVARSGADDLALTQLLSIARLTPAQAVALGADLLACLEDAAGRSLQRPEGARVGRDGRARVIAAGPSANGAGLAIAAALLDSLRAATRPSAADHGLISALERAATEARSPHGRLAIVAAILREADGAGGAQARSELARLVAIVLGEVPALDAARAPRTPAPRRRRPRPTPRAVARAAAARSWKWVLSLVVLVAVVLIEIAFLREEISRDIQAVLDAGRSGSTVTSTPTLPPVAPPAPTAVGTISRIDLRSVTPCTPDAGCALRVQVTLQPQAEPQTITWDFRVVDRCTGEAVTVPGGTVTVPPHADRADVVSTVGLPPADALAVLAVTNQPFAAASAAVNVPAPGACGIHEPERG